MFLLKFLFVGGIGLIFVLKSVAKGGDRGYGVGSLSAPVGVF